jgi:hypothetical protein
LFGPDPSIWNVPYYDPSVGGQFVSNLRPGSYWGIKEGSSAAGEFNETYTAMGGKTVLGRVGSNVFYYAGHQYTDTNGVRFYLNAVLIPAERDQSCGFVVDQYV